MDDGLRPGAEVAGHRLERVIAAGGMSVVYLAEHLQLQRKVAFKVLSPHLAEDEAFRDRFIRESRTAAALDHPNIVTIYDAGEREGRLYISMRYVEGSDLRKVLTAGGALDPWRALSILSQVGSALDAAHAEGLVHRDVKPGNILLAQPGTVFERAFLTDFGVTKRMEPGTALTRTGQFVGTVDYVAPEQILAEPVDGRTDVYSVGCVLYECLAGRAPYERPTDVATIYAHLQDQVPSLDERQPTAMQAVIDRSLAKAKDDRYPTCGALVEAARSAMPDDTRSTAVLSAPKPSTPSTPPRRGRRRIAAVVVAAVVVAGVIAALALAARPERSDAGTTSTPPPTSPPPVAAAAGPLIWQATPWHEWADVPGEVAFNDSLLMQDGGVIAVGHADIGMNEDAVVWTQREGRWDRHYVDGKATPGAQRISGITEVGDRLIAVGYNGAVAAAWYSDDGGSTWQTAEGMAGAPTARTVEAAADGTMWALGEGAIWRSSDGATWQLESSDAFPAEADVYGSTTVGDKVVAVGQMPDADGNGDAAVWVLDATGWSRVPSAAFDQRGSQSLTDVIVAPDGTVVSVGLDSTSGKAIAFVADDPRSWSKARVPAGAETQKMNAVTYLPTDGEFVAGGQTTGATTGGVDAAIWISSDGKVWSRQAGKLSTFALTDGAEPLEIRSLVAYDRPAIDVLAFGIAGVDMNAEAKLWNGFATRSG
jgi:serine/threonine protein kinase